MLTKTDREKLKIYSKQLEKANEAKSCSLTLSRTTHIEVMQICVIFYLDNIKGSQNELERFYERFLRLDGKLGTLDYSRMLGVSGGSPSDETDRLIARLEAYQCYMDVVEQVSEKIEHAKKLIEQTPHGELLWLHYVDGVKWRTLALRNRLNSSTIYRWKMQAIQHLYCMMPEEYRRYAIPNACPL